MRLLLVEDTADLAQSVLRFLTAAGHAVDHAPDAATAAEAVALTEYACVVLDLGLPDGSGLDLLRQWRRAGLALTLTVNVSARQIPDGLPASAILAAVDRHGIMPHWLGLEITESLLLADLTGAQAWLDEVRAAGFQAYLDDFGTGYSSLSYLKRFQVDKVKIDKAFIRDIAEDASDRALVGAVIILAGSLAFEVVAEGIETAEQAHFLTDISCHYGQGYYFSRPVPARDFPAALDHIDGLWGD